MILIVDNHSKNVPLIEKIFRENNVRFVVRDQKSVFRNIDDHAYKGIVLSGGRPVLDKKIYFDTIKADISCLVNYGVPILGICVGHEIIGEACGAELRKLKNPAWIPELKVKILKKTGIFKGLANEIVVYEHHSRYLKNLPNEIVLAATSKKTKVEAIFHKKRKIFGLQFHPEKSGGAGEKIFRNFIEICYQ